MVESEYTNGVYLAKNPTWHSEDSPFKAQQILRMIARRGLTPQTICEIGCGTGGILRVLQDSMPATCSFEGYEVSPQALAVATSHQRPRLTYHLQDITRLKCKPVDLIVVMDVIEHVEDYMSFLRSVRERGEWKIFHVPLDITIQGVLRNSLLTGWDNVGHIHAFTKDIALRAITHTGYDIVDYFYTDKTESAHCNRRMRVAGIPRRIVFGLHNDLCVRLLGGYSLLVLAR